MTTRWAHYWKSIPDSARYCPSCGIPQVGETVPEQPIFTHCESHLSRRERTGLLNRVNVDNLSEARRLSIMYYCYLLSKNVFENAELRQVHKRLSVSKEFYALLFKNLKMLQPDYPGSRKQE